MACGAAAATGAGWIPAPRGCGRSPLRRPRSRRRAPPPRPHQPCGVSYPQPALRPKTTGFWSSALHNDFIRELEGRTERQVDYRRKPEDGFEAEFTFGPRNRAAYLSPDDKTRAEAYVAQGFEAPLRTPDDSLIFVTPEKAAEIHTDQTDCMGCLSQCRFSNWAQNEEHSNGRKADPRSFCIQKTLLDISHDGDVDQNLVFGGHNAFYFATDPFFSNGFIPTVKELFDRIASGD